MPKISRSRSESEQRLRVLLVPGKIWATKRRTFLYLPTSFSVRSRGRAVRYWKDFSDQRSTFEESWYADLVYALLIAAAFAFAWYLAEQ